MRPLGMRRQDFGPIEPDAVHNIAAAAGGYAADFPSSTGDPKPQFLQVNSNVLGFLAVGSTGATVPTSNLTTGSSGFELFGPGNPLMREIPGNSTGYSIALATSGYVSVSFWGQ